MDADMLASYLSTYQDDVDSFLLENKSIANIALFLEIFARLCESTSHCLDVCSSSVGPHFRCIERPLIKIIKFFIKLIWFSSNVVVCLLRNVQMVSIMSCRSKNFLFSLIFPKLKISNTQIFRKILTMNRNTLRDYLWFTGKILYVLFVKDYVI
jgi:hypothetical protein